MKYRRTDITGGTYFFTINLADRKSRLLVDEIHKLRHSSNKVKQSRPFVLDAMVVLPDHIHLLITLPEGDSDFPTRIMLIKSGFSRQILKIENIRESRSAKRERGIWQRRYWEYFIRDETDFERYVDYIHYNPVKHGYVNQAIQWEFSTIHKYIENRLISSEWGSNQDYLSETPFGER